MSKHRHEKGKVGQQHREEMISSLSGVMTPGRDPAEGPDIEFASPTHERWEQGTPGRDPAEGQDITALPQQRAQKK